MVTGKKEEEKGEEDADKIQANGPPGQFGVLAANWGGKWGNKSEDDYMNDDIEHSVCQLIVAQEVEPGFWLKMNHRAAKKHEATMKANGDGVEIPLAPVFIGVRGFEGPGASSLLITGKPGIVLGVRQRLFQNK